MKASFHESGVCSVSFLEGFYLKMSADGADYTSRHLDRWRRTDNYLPGVSLLFRVVFPRSELRQHPKVEKPITWLSPPPLGLQKEVVLFMARQKHGQGWPGAHALRSKLVFEKPLPNGEWLWLVSAVREITPGLVARVEDTCSAARSNAPKWKRSDIVVGNQGQRLIVGAVEGDGSRSWTDLAVDTVFG
jgi:hypothetical protein